MDYLITYNAHLVNNLTVDNQNPICKSDHYAIKFNLSLNIQRKRLPKRYVYNFKHANWEALNTEFSNTNWIYLLDCDNIENSWYKFKTKFFEICNKHIPKIKISNEFKPPWYDSEVYELDRKKACLHAQFKKIRK